MKKTIGLATVLLAIAAAASAQDANVPELVVGLEPASGLIPLESQTGSLLYRFQVRAIEADDARTVEISSETFVEAGQSRKILKRQKDWSLEGTVTVSESGNVQYRLLLFKHGERVSSASASLVLQSDVLHMSR